MVECESITDKTMSALSVVLIDTWWNVNSASVFSVTIKVMVLIDTWWNVNLQEQKNYIKKVIVLIDTWWNVNVCSKRRITEVKSFNRYMVECE